MENCEAMTSLPHSFAYSYRLVKKCFLNICETSKCHNFLIFQPIFIRFSLLCLKMFTLSSEIKLNLLWSSSLKLVKVLPRQTFGAQGGAYLRFNNPLLNAVKAIYSRPGLVHFSILECRASDKKAVGIPF